MFKFNTVLNILCKCPSNLYCTQKSLFRHSGRIWQGSCSLWSFLNFQSGIDCCLGLNHMKAQMDQTAKMALMVGNVVVIWECPHVVGNVVIIWGVPTRGISSLSFLGLSDFLHGGWLSPECLKKSRWKLHGFFLLPKSHIITSVIFHWSKQL